MSVYSDFQVDLDNHNSSWTLLYNLIEPNAVILDIGCSSGYFDAVLIKDKNCIVDGIEIDPADATAAAKVCRSVITGNIEDLPLSRLPEEKYDYILFVDVLEHLVDPIGTLRKVTSLLKPTGKILFSIPNMAHSSVRLELLNGSFEYEDEGLLDRTHLHFHTRQSVQNMFKAADLTINQLDRTIFDLPPVIIDQALERVGLKASSEFLSRMNEGDAVTYQFIGAASKIKKPSVGEKSAYVEKPLTHYRDQLEKLQADVRQYFAVTQDTRTELAALTAKNIELSAQKGIAHRILNKGKRLLRP